MAIHISHTLFKRNSNQGYQDLLPLTTLIFPLNLFRSFVPLFLVWFCFPSLQPISLAEPTLAPIIRLEKWSLFFVYSKWIKKYNQRTTWTIIMIIIIILVIRGFISISTHIASIHFSRSKKSNYLNQTGQGILFLFVWFKENFTNV